jgi:hypothetical protein
LQERNDKKKQVATSRLSIKKRLLFVVVMLALAFFGIELLVRGYFAMKVGPDVWLYGTPFSKIQERFDPIGARIRKLKLVNTTSFHENELDNYSKYYPNQKRFDHDKSGNRFDVTINSSGFRGKDFEPRKPADTIRVVTLGASSTFGFSNRDNETYPFYMQELLNMALPKLKMQNPSYASIERFEVINLGIPHLLTENIYSLFMAEGVTLDPDFVTFYEGVNDSVYRPPISEATEKTKNAIKSVPLTTFLARQLRWRFISVALLGMTVSNHMADEFSEQDYQDGLEDKYEAFIGYLQRIQNECKRRDIVFIVANQQAQSFYVDKQEMRGVTYAEELARVREKLSRTDNVNSYELYFLIHHNLMNDLRRFAEAEEIPFVDVIGALDSRRDLLTSWVHLRPEANQVVAAVFSDAILESVSGHSDTRDKQEVD